MNISSRFIFSAFKQAAKTIGTRLSRFSPTQAVALSSALLITAMALAPMPAFAQQNYYDRKQMQRYHDLTPEQQRGAREYLRKKSDQRYYKNQRDQDSFFYHEPEGTVDERLERLMGGNLSTKFRLKAITIKSLMETSPATGEKMLRRLEEEQARKDRDDAIEYGKKHPMREQSDVYILENSDGSQTIIRHGPNREEVEESRRLDQYYQRGQDLYVDPQQRQAPQRTTPQRDFSNGRGFTPKPK